MRILSITHPYLGQFSNSYVIAGEGSALLVDTGLVLGRAMLEEAAPRVEAVLSTHGHWDHTGNHRHFQQKGAAVLGMAEDAKLFGDMEDQWDLMYEQFRNDFQIPEARREIYRTDAGEAVTLDRCLRDGERLDFQGCEIQVIHTPGHTPGSCCFYLPEQQVLFTGDTVFDTGFFSALPQLSDPAAYEKTLERLRALPVKTAYTAHYAEPLDQERYQGMLAQQGQSIEKLWQLSREFLRKTPGEKITVGGLAAFCCDRMGKSMGSSACVTAVAYLYALAAEFPAAAACVKGYRL